MDVQALAKLKRVTTVQGFPLFVILDVQTAKSLQMKDVTTDSKLLAMDVIKDAKWNSDIIAQILLISLQHAWLFAEMQWKLRMKVVMTETFPTTMVVQAHALSKQIQVVTSLYMQMYVTCVETIRERESRNVTMEIGQMA